jgi:hypothetical protein
MLCWWIGLPLLGLLSIGCQRWQLRREAAALLAGRLPAEALLLVKVPAAQQAALRWEHSREFELEGKMYDLARDSAGADTAYYWCLRDEAEERLNREAEAMIASGLGRPRPAEGGKALESLAWRFSLPPVRRWPCLHARAERAGERPPSAYAAQHPAPPAPPPEAGLFSPLWTCPLLRLRSG